jgi:gas vesicle protein
MADGHDRFDSENGGSSFVAGLLTGTVLGAGLGMLFAPRAGSELRHQISDQAGNLANTASEGYRRASETAGTWAEKGRDVVGKARDAVNRGMEEAQRYAREASNPSGSSSATSEPSTGGSSFGSSYGSSSYGTESRHGGSEPQGPMGNRNRS